MWIGRSDAYALLSPPTLTRAEQETLLRVSSEHPRDHVIFSLALGTGLRLAEIVGLNVADVFAADGTPRSRIRLRKEIAKGGRAGDVFLPDALGPKLVRFWGYKVRSGESVVANAPLHVERAQDCCDTARRIPLRLPTDGGDRCAREVRCREWMDPNIQVRGGCPHVDE